MEHLFKDLEKAVFSRLLNINNDIRLARKMNASIGELKTIRRQTDKLLSKIKISLRTSNLNQETYALYKSMFLNPLTGENDDLQKQYYQRFGESNPKSPDSKTSPHNHEVQHELID